MKIYEDNFKRLMWLLPELRQCAGHECREGERQEGLHVSVLEHHKYTTVIKLAQHLPVSFMKMQPSMVVRIYHDAQVAEVLSYQHHHRFKPKYDYPNPDMCQIREKQRVNEFLGEWLDYCFTGNIPVQTPAPV